MATTVISSFNIFVDSGRYITSQSKGDHVHIPLSDTPISCADNQFLRLTLQDFNMVKNFPNVNTNNSMFRIKYNDSQVGEVIETVFLAHKNFKNVRDLAEEFAMSFAKGIEALTKGPLLGHVQSIDVVSTTIILPESNSNAFGNSNNLIAFRAQFSGPPPAATDLAVLFKVEDGDAYELLGGKKITNTNQVANSVEIVEDTGFPNTLIVKCPYPAQRFTEEHVYLRTDLPSTNLQTMSYSSGNSDGNNGIHIGPSRILGKIPIGEAICQFHSSTGNEYTLNLKQKNFTMMELHLTDSHGRPLPYDNPEQAVNGNLNFKCTIKVETIQHMGQQNNQLQTDRPQKSVSARFGSAPLEYLDYGAPRTNR